MDLAGSSVDGHGNLMSSVLPEILLIWAEKPLSNCEGKNLTQAHIDYSINRLRDRVNMHRIEPLGRTLAHGGWILETELRRERRIELWRQGTRYADVMRWREVRTSLWTSHRLQGCMKMIWAPTPYPDRVDEFGDVIYEKSTPAARVTSTTKRGPSPCSTGAGNDL